MNLKSFRSIFVLFAITILPIMATGIEDTQDNYKRISQAIRTPFNNYKKSAPQWLPANIGFMSLMNMPDENEFLITLQRMAVDNGTKAIIIEFPPHDSLDSGTVSREIKHIKKYKPIIALIVGNCFAEDFVAATSATYVMSLYAIELGKIGGHFTQEYLVPLESTHPKSLAFQNWNDLLYAGLCKRTPNKEMPDACRTAINGFVQAMHKELTRGILHNRPRAVEHKTEWNTGKTFLATHAVEYKLVDSIGGFAQALQIAKQLSNAPQTCDSCILDQHANTTCPAHMTIAELSFTGAIGNWDERNILQYCVSALRTFAHDSRVDAILLRIKSPGGVVSVAEYIFREIQAATKTKPVIVLISGMALSGGYLIACGGYTIYATPLSGIGNIGVAQDFPIPNVIVTKGDGQMYEKRIQTFSSGSDLCTDGTWCAPAQEEASRTLKVLYDYFVELVAQSRMLDTSRAHEWAEGKIFSTTQAKRNGLIDKISSPTESLITLLSIVQKNRQLHEKTGVKIVTYSPPINNNHEETD